VENVHSKHMNKTFQYHRTFSTAYQYIA